MAPFAPWLIAALLAAPPPRTAKVSPAMPLTTLAAASPRPAECRPRGAVQESELWARARGETMRRYCGLLARGYARLERAPAEALELAESARKLFPAGSEPRVLAGRARLRLGQWNEARAALEGSVTAPGRPLGDVGALRELSLASMLSGNLDAAVATYRVLVPRAEFAQDRVFGRIVLLEAAASAMARGPSGVEEALLYLGDARQKSPVPGLTDLTVALFALALDRAGKREQADVALRELSSVWALEQFLSPAERARVVRLSLAGAPETQAAELAFSPRTPRLVEGELSAALAVAGRLSDPKLAQTHWAAYLETPAGRGVWAEWARARAAVLPRAREASP